MRKIIPYIFNKMSTGILILASVFIISKMNAHAELDLNKLYYDLYGQNVGIETSMQYGIINQNQGWLCYIINESGHIVYQPQFFYKTGGYVSWDNCDNIKGAGLSADGLKSRIDSVSPTVSHSGYEWGDSMIGTSQSGAQAVVDYMYSGGTVYNRATYA